MTHCCGTCRWKVHATPEGRPAYDWCSWNWEPERWKQRPFWMHGSTIRVRPEQGDQCPTYEIATEQRAKEEG